MNDFYIGALRSALAILIAICAAAALSCNTVETERGDGAAIGGLDDTSPSASERKPPGLDITPSSSGEEIWRNRCSTCHVPEYRIDKYHGEQWEFVIGRMIKMEGAMFTPELAEMVYEYLYNRTKRPGDPPFEEVIKGRSQFEVDSDEEVPAAPAPAH